MNKKEKIILFGASRGGENFIKFIKDLSIINQMPIPNVGEELVNNEGITVAEAELLWEEYSIALVLEETDLNIDGIKIFTLTKLNELKNELLERIS